MAKRGALAATTNVWILLCRQDVCENSKLAIFTVAEFNSSPCITIILTVELRQRVSLNGGPGAKKSVVAGWVNVAIATLRSWIVVED